MDAPLISIAKIVDLCRTLPGVWIDHFKYDFRRERWVFKHNGEHHRVGLEAMPAIAEQLGGWPDNRGVAAS